MDTDSFIDLVAGRYGSFRSMLFFFPPFMNCEERQFFIQEEKNSFIVLKIVLLVFKNSYIGKNMQKSRQSSHALRQKFIGECCRRTYRKRFLDTATAVLLCFPQRSFPERVFWIMPKFFVSIMFFFFFLKCYI